MKTITRIFTAAFLFSLILMASVNVSMAQSVEDEEYMFTEYYLDELPKSLEQGTQPDIVAAPNPSTDNILKVWYNRISQASELSVYDAAGKLFHSATIGNSRDTKGLYQVPVSNLSPGMYLVTLRSGAHQVVKKVIIK